MYHSAVVGAWRERDRRLRAAGHDVTLVSPQRWNEGGSVVTLDPGDDTFVVPARTLGRHPYVFVYDPRPIWRALRSGPVDILDIHEEPASLAAAELLILRTLAGRRRAKVIFYGAQNIEKRFPLPFRWIERAALKAAAGAYCCNRAAADIFRAKGFNGAVSVIGLGVDIERFAPRVGDRVDGPFRIGYVGRLEQRKGVQVVLEALAELPATVELDLHGSGPYEAELRRIVDQRGLSDRVRFKGFCHYEQLPDTYRGFDTLVVPSQTTETWVEQFGRVAVEAMASGVPVIASNSGSLPEVLAGAGIIVPEADVSSWARAIGSLAAHSDDARRLSAAGVTRARAYCWSAVAADHGALYEQVLR